MSSWSHGYNVSAGYTYGFYRETAPDWIDFALSLRGLIPPRAQAGAPFRYLELGSGQGFGLCLLALANPEGEFLGVDFSPEHIAHARSLAYELGLANISFVEGDFAVLGASWPGDYGQFDYVMLHGIYSWVPEAIRGSLVRILTAAATPGAAIYLSHNAMPGWASTMPFQHVLRLLETEGVARNIAAVEAGRTLFDTMDAAGSGVTKALPGLRAKIETTRKQPEAYLVQEYLHENWHPLWCSQVMSELEGAKLGLAATATLAENLLPQILPEAMQEVLAGADRPKLREDLTDCLINQSFRRDIYVRGPRRRPVADQGWLDSYCVWRVNRTELPEEVQITTAYGAVKLQRADLQPLLDAIGTGSRTLAELAALPAAKADPQLLGKKLVLMIHSGWLCCSRRTPEGGASVAAANRRIAALAALGAPYRHLAAANLGSGIVAIDSDLIMLDAWSSDPQQFERDGAAMVKQRLQRIGRRLAKDGKPLSDADEQAQMAGQVRTFCEQTLPAWRDIGVLD